MTLFSKIAAGEIPSYMCAEDDKFYAFLDINPVAKGHTLVIPRKEIDYIFDMNDDDLAQFEVVLGLEVNHAHIHLLPINTEADVDFHKHIKLPEEEMKATAEKIYSEFKKIRNL